MRFIHFVIVIICVCFLSLTKVNGQSAYRGGKGDGYASGKVEGININNGSGPSFSGIKIFPNPLVSNILNITFPQLPAANVRIMLVDVTGRICYLNDSEIKNKKYTIQIPQIANGTYFLIVNTEKEEFKNKLIVIKE